MARELGAEGVALARHQVLDRVRLPVGMTERMAGRAG